MFLHLMMYDRSSKVLIWMVERVILFNISLHAISISFIIIEKGKKRYTSYSATTNSINNSAAVVSLRLRVNSNMHIHIHQMHYVKSYLSGHLCNDA